MRTKRDAFRPPVYYECLIAVSRAAVCRNDSGLCRRSPPPLPGEMIDRVRTEQTQPPTVAIELAPTDTAGGREPLKTVLRFNVRSRPFSALKQPKKKKKNCFYFVFFCLAFSIKT